MANKSDKKPIVGQKGIGAFRSKRERGDKGRRNSPSVQQGGKGEETRCRTWYQLPQPDDFQHRIVDEVRTIDSMPSGCVIC